MKKYRKLLLLGAFLSFSLFPLGVYVTINGWVSLKYEVDHARTFLEMDRAKLSLDQFTQQEKAINAREDQLASQILTSKITAIAGIVLGVLILMYRRKVK